jgi:1-acyl-sn-glycerol-3-phosphate acyltransferase
VTGTLGTERAARGDLNVWWRFGAPIAVLIVRALFRVRVVGIHHVPLEGPAILAFVHVSVLDGPCLAAEVAWRRRRTVRFLVASEIFDMPVSGWFLRRYRQIPVNRGMSDAGALEEVIATIRRGAVAAIAPEGIVNPTPGELQRIRSGIARIALPTGAPVIPVGIWGTHRRWSKAGRHWGRPFRPRFGLAFGPAIEPHGDVSDQDDIDAVVAQVGDALERQLTEARSLAGDLPL